MSRFSCRPERMSCILITCSTKYYFGVALTFMGEKLVQPLSVKHVNEWQGNCRAKVAINLFCCLVRLLR